MIHSFSIDTFKIDENEFTAMVKAVREAEVAVGKVDYTLTEKMQKSREFSRSLYVVKDIKTGERITEENVRSIRPGYGLHPKYYKEIMGRRILVDLQRGTPLKKEYIHD
jgi:pseudaminic acid synthase